MKTINDWIMIGLYKYISEGLLRGMEDTLSTGEQDSERILIEDWLKENREYVYIKDDISKCLTNDNKINARSFTPWYAYGSKALQLPAPDYIKFGEVDAVSMSLQKNVNFAELPHIDTANEVSLQPFMDGFKLDISDLPIDNIHEFSWAYEKCDISNYPKKTKIDAFVMWIHPVTWRCYNSFRYKIGFDKLKGLKCNSLAIPDVIFTENFYDFGNGNESYIKKGAIEFDSQAGKALLKLYNNTAIQFNKLYVYCASDSIHKFHEIRKEKTNFRVVKRATKSFASY